MIWQKDQAETIKVLVEKHWSKDLLARRQNESLGRESEQALKVEIIYNETEEPDLVLNNLLKEWQEEVWREELTEVVHQLKLVNPKTEPELVEKYLKRCQELSQMINNKL